MLNSEEDLDEQERIAAGVSNPKKVAAIRAFNLSQGFPIEDPVKVLFNGAIFEAPQLNPKLFLVVSYNFNHPLSAYPPDVQTARIRQYAQHLAENNQPWVSFIGINQANLAVAITTNEVNRHGYWVQVDRTVFLHKAEPVVSIDIIATSTTPAPPDYPASPDYKNTFCAPDNIWYIRLADLRPPQ